MRAFFMTQTEHSVAARVKIDNNRIAGRNAVFREPPLRHLKRIAHTDSARDIGEAERGHVKLVADFSRRVDVRD